MAEPDVLPGSQQPAAKATEPRKAQPGYADWLKQPGHEEEAEIIREVEARVNYAEDIPSRWALLKELYENLCFVQGIQWIECSDQTRQFQKIQTPAFVPTPVDNQIKPRVIRMHAALLKAKPRGRVRPNTNEAADRDAADIADALVQHAYDVCDEMQLRQVAAMIAAVSGTVIADDCYNPRLGKTLRVPRGQTVEQPVMEPTAQCPNCGAQQPVEHVGLPCPQCGMQMVEAQAPLTLGDGTPATEPQFVPETDETGQPIIDEIPEGELESRTLQLFNFYWDAKATTLKQAQWCGEVGYHDLDWIDETFPETGPFVAEESGVSQTNFFEASLLALVGPSVQGSAHHGGHQMYKNGAVVRRYQRKPCKKYPRGLYAIVANGVLLYKGDLPIKDENGYPTGDFTYSVFAYDLVPGRFAGSSPVGDMVPCQRRINARLSQIIMNTKTLLSPWILAPNGSGLEPGKTYLRPGAVVPYNFIGVGQAPQVVQGTPLPDQIWKEIEAAIQTINTLAEDAVQDAMKPPEQMRSGIALNFAREEQEEFKMPRRERWALWIRERDRKRLLLMQQHYREERAIKTTGADNDYKVHRWRGADLRGNTDIVIDPGSLIPQSKSLKHQLVLDLIETQVLNPMNPMVRQQILEELGLGHFEIEVGPDRKKARKENATMDEGLPVMMTEWEDKLIHLTEHTARMRDPSFENLPPEAQQAHIMHWMETRTAVAMEAAAQMQAQAAAQPAGKNGKPGGGPPAPGPSANGNGAGPAGLEAPAPGPDTLPG